VSFGQTVCLPINPKCQTCPVKSVCRYYREKAGKIRMN
jgi:endonuclease III